MSDKEIKLACLEIAKELSPQLATTESLIKDASKLWDFIYCAPKQSMAN